MPLEPKRHVNLLRAAWVAGYSQGSYSIPCESLAAARRLRFRLYETVKDIRRGKEQCSEELREAVAECELQIVETTLVIRKKELPAGLLALAAQMEVDIKTPVREMLPAEVEASMQRVKEELEKEATGPRVTPYYTRS